MASLSLLALRRSVLVPDHRLLLKFRIEVAKDRAIGMIWKEEWLTSGGVQDEFVKGEALATSLSDSGASSLSETKSSNGELWNLEDSLIICDSADDDGDSVANRAR